MSSDDLLIALPAEAYTTLDASSYLDLTTPARLDGLVESCGTLTGEPQAVQPPPLAINRTFPAISTFLLRPLPPPSYTVQRPGVFPAEQQLEETLLCPGPVDLTFALPRHHGYPPPTLLTRLSSTMPPPSFPTNHLLALVPSKLHFWCSRKPTFTAHTGDCPTSAADLNALTSTTTNATRSPARGPNAPESYQAPARTPSHRFRIAHPSPALPPRPICSQPQAATKQQLQDQAFPPPPPFFCPIYRTGHAPREALDLALAPETCRQPTLDVPLQTWKPSRRFPLDTPFSQATATGGDPATFVSSSPTPPSPADYCTSLFATDSAETRLCSAFSGSSLMGRRPAPPSPPPFSTSLSSYDLRTSVRSYAQ